LMFLYLYHKVLSYRTPIFHPRTVAHHYFPKYSVHTQNRHDGDPRRRNVLFRLKGGIQRDVRASSA
jgi:hypothetical protein